MKKFFIVSDIHSFFTPFITELHKKGFEEDNPEHFLVILGDLFDRGNETLELYDYLTSIPKDRRVFIRGNHEDLYKELMYKEYPDSYDFSNGTVKTFCQIAGIPEERLTFKYWYKRACKGELVGGDEFSKIATTWELVVKRVKDSPITKFIYDDNEWAYYLESDHYIFVHSWIPTAQRITDYGSHIEDLGYREDWRCATPTEWNDATWGCPWSKAKEGWNKTGKTIVCGHWHTSDFFNNLTKQKKKDIYDCPIFKSKRYKLIGIDACTAGSHKVNVLVLTEEEM